MSIQKKILVFFIFILSIGAIFGSIFLYKEKSRQFLTVAFLDVGQGDSIFIEAPNGNQLMVDGGPTASVARSVSKILPFYDRKIDFLIATHSDTDHTAGFPEIFKRYRVGAYARSERKDDDALFTEIENLADAEQSDRFYLKAGDRLVLDEKRNIYIDILWPKEGEIFKDNNSSSVITRIVYGSTSFLLTGDAPSEIEDKVLSAIETNLATTTKVDSQIRSDVLKAGHHGSKYSSSAEFLQAVDPEYTVISAGKDNKYGHPSPEVIERLLAQNTKILETAASSTIVFQSDGEKVWLR